MAADPSWVTIGSLCLGTLGFIAGIFWNTSKTRDDLTKDAKGIEERLNKKLDDSVTRLHCKIETVQAEQSRMTEGVRSDMSERYVDHRYLSVVTEKMMSMLQNMENKIDSLAKRFDDVLLTHGKK